MAIRSTRIPLDPDYTALLGEAVYVFAYAEWLLLEIIRLRDATATHDDLARMMSGEVARRLREALSSVPPDRERGIAAQFAELVQLRNDMIHAHPATAHDGSQRLYRWAPDKQRFGFVSRGILEQFIADVEDLNSDASALRAYLKAEEGAIDA
jgi:hypothetical protein